MNEGLKLFLYFINGLIYLAVAGLWLVSPEDKTLNFALTIFNLAFTSILLYQGRSQIQAMEKNKTIRNWGYTGINLFLVLVIIAFLNYISFKNAAQFDVSNGQINSLSSASINIIKGLKKQLDVHVFARKDDAQAIVTLLDLYRIHKSDTNIDVLDPDLRPDLVKQYGIEKIPTVVMEHDKNKEFVEEQSELAYTNALLKLAREKKPVIYYSVGHLETNFDSQEKNGGGLIKNAILRAQFDFRPLDLISAKDVPSDASALLIWGPKTGFFEPEIVSINNYLENGGRVMLALDPTISEDKVTGLRKFFKSSWEVEISNNIIVDVSSHVSGSKGTVPMIKHFDPRHFLTKAFDGQVFFPLVSEVKKFETDNAKGIFKPLAFSSEFPGSWADSSPFELASGSMIYNSPQDKKGPIAMMASWEEVLPPGEKRQNARILAFGNSSFIHNPYALLADNFQLMLKSLVWISTTDQLFSLNLPVPKNDPVFLTPEKQRMLFYSSVIGVPVLMMFLAFLIFRKRKKL